jgi:hypothetical protein
MFVVRLGISGICMTVLYLEALVAIVLSLAVLLACAWIIQQRTGNSGWVIPSGRLRWGWSGSAVRCGPSPAPSRMRGNGWSRPWSLSGRCGSPASRRSRSRCCARAARATATTSRAPACSFHGRRKRERRELHLQHHRQRRTAARPFQELDADVRPQGKSARKKPVCRDR